MKLSQNALITLIVGAGLAQASHISLDSAFGPGTITLDTATGLQWLDLTVTNGRSTDWVLEQTAPGGLLYGWWYATIGQLDAFAAPYLVILASGSSCSVITTCSAVPLEIEGVQAFVDLVGRVGGGTGTRGLLHPFGDMVLVAAFFIYDDDAMVDVQGVNYPYDCGDGDCGMFLVRTPEPSSAVFVFTGLVMYVLTRRLRHATPYSA